MTGELRFPLPLPKKNLFVPNFEGFYSHFPDLAKDFFFSLSHLSIHSLTLFLSPRNTVGSAFVDTLTSTY